MAGLDTWDVSAASNNDAPPDGWPENTMNYSDVNNTGREGMAVLARFFQDINGTLTAGGAADAYTLTLNEPYSAYFAGMYFSFEVQGGATNTGASTINVNTIGVEAIKKRDGSALDANTLIAGGIYELRYDGTNFQLMGTISSAADLTLASLVLSTATNPDLVDNFNTLNLGAIAGAHLAAGPALIQAKASISTAAALSINTLGGNVAIGSGAVVSIGGTGGRFDVASTQAVALDNNTNAVNIGALAGAHLALSGAIIQAKASATTAANLAIGSLGGLVDIGVTAAARLRMTADGFDVVNAVAGTTILDVIGSGTNIDGVLGVRGDSGGARFKWDESVTAALIKQTTAGGTEEDIWIRMVDNGLVGLGFNGTEEAVTQDSDADYNTSGMTVNDHAGTPLDVGFNVMPAVEDDNTTLTLSEVHASKVVHKDGGTTKLITLPSGTSGAVMPVGTLAMISNDHSGAFTIAAAGTLEHKDGSDGASPTGTRTLAQSSVATVYHYTDTVWWIWGNGLT